MQAPILDLQSPNIKQEIHNALYEYSFFLIKNHPYKTFSTTHFYESYLNFFQSNQKHNFTYDYDLTEGYVSLEKAEKAKNYPIRDYKEYFHYYPWGRCPENLNQMSSEMFAYLKQIADTCVLSLSENPELQFANKIKINKICQGSSNTFLRISHYPPSKRLNKIIMRAAPHHDINFLTIQPPASTPGLECFFDNAWHLVDNNDHIFVGAGEMLEYYSEGLYKPCYHRVQAPEQNETNIDRISTMLFLHPRAEAVLTSNKTSHSILKKRIVELGLIEEI